MEFIVDINVAKARVENTPAGQRLAALRKFEEKCRRYGESLLSHLDWMAKIKDSIGKETGVYPVTANAVSWFCPKCYEVNHAAAEAIHRGPFSCQKCETKVSIEMP